MAYVVSILGLRTTWSSGEEVGRATQQVNSLSSTQYLYTTDTVDQSRTEETQTFLHVASVVVVVVPPTHACAPLVGFLNTWLSFSPTRVGLSWV